MTESNLQEWEQTLKVAKHLLDLARASDSGPSDVRTLRLMIYAKHRYGITLTFQEAKDLTVQNLNDLLGHV